MPRSVDQVIHARWVVTVDADDKVLEKHAVVVDNGSIVSIIPSSEVAQQYVGVHEITLEDHALMPGLVNAHTHAPMSLMRGLADDKALMEWLQNHIWPAEAKHVSPEFVRIGSQLAAAEMLRGGTTCFNDMYFFPEVTAEVVSEIGVRASLGMIVIDFPSAYAENADDYLAKGLATRERFADNPLFSFTLAPHAPYTVSDAPLQQVAKLSAELDCPVHMHVHETSQEVADATAQAGTRPLARLHDLGLLNERMIAVHMTQLSADEIQLLAANHVHVAHCPESNLKLASGFCPVAELIAAGVNVCVGTDGTASNNDLDMLGETRTAALLAKGVASDATALPAPQALRMATINAAKALGLDKRIGSLEVGKQADVIAVNMNELETLPLFDLPSQLVYATGRQQVSDVWVAGKRLLDNRQLTTIDVAALRQATLEWQERIAPDAA